MRLRRTLSWYDIRRVLKLTGPYLGFRRERLEELLATCKALLIEYHTSNNSKAAAQVSEVQALLRKKLKRRKFCLVCEAITAGLHCQMHSRLHKYRRPRRLNFKSTNAK